MITAPAGRVLTAYERALLVITVAAAAACRLFALGRLPGLNGDEAWYGVNVQAMVDGGSPFWHTGIGNPLNPLHTGPLLAMTAIYPQPSFVVVRATEAVYGVLAVALAYPLLRRSIGVRAALIATVLIAISPIAIAYSRFGWDPSGTPLIGLVAIACAMRNRPASAAVACIAAWFVHPTNVFLWPVAAAAWAPHGLAAYRAAPQAWRQRLHVTVAVAIVIAIPIVAWFVMRVAANQNTSLPSIAMVIERLTSPAIWIEVGVGIGRMFAGISSAQHISGPLPSAAVTAADVTTFAIVMSGVILCWRDRIQMRWMGGGVILALGAFIVVAGPDAVVPQHERYALSFLMPLILIVAAGSDALIETRRVIGIAMLASTLVMFATSTAAGYFAPLVVDGGRSLDSFRTGTVEPKAAAYEFIRADSGASQVSVIAQDWWTYWPLRYLSRPDAARIRIDVLPGANMPGGERPAGAPVPPPLTGEVKRYAVLFETGVEWAALRKRGTQPLFTARDPRGRAILHVVALRAGAHELAPSAAPAVPANAARPQDR